MPTTLYLLVTYLPDVRLRDYINLIIPSATIVQFSLWSLRYPSGAYVSLGLRLFDTACGAQVFYRLCVLQLQPVEPGCSLYYDCYLYPFVNL